MLISTISVKRSVCNIVIRDKALFLNFAFLCLIGGKMQFFYPFLKDMKRERKYL